MFLYRYWFTKISLKSWCFLKIGSGALLAGSWGCLLWNHRKRLWYIAFHQRTLQPAWVLAHGKSSTGLVCRRAGEDYGIQEPWWVRFRKNPTAVQGPKKDGSRLDVFSYQNLPSKSSFQGLEIMKTRRHLFEAFLLKLQTLGKQPVKSKTEFMQQWTQSAAWIWLINARAIMPLQKGMKCRLKLITKKGYKPRLALGHSWESWDWRPLGGDRLCTRFQTPKLGSLRFCPQH